MSRHHFQLFIFNHIFSDTTPLDVEVYKDIKQATKSVIMNSVEQTAYYCAMGEKKQLDMGKYRKQVQNELASASSQKGYKIFSTVIIHEIFH